MPFAFLASLISPFARPRRGSRPLSGLVLILLATLSFPVAASQTVRSLRAMNPSEEEEVRTEVREEGVLSHAEGSHTRRRSRTRLSLDLDHCLHGAAYTYRSSQPRFLTLTSPRDYFHRHGVGLPLRC